MANELALANPDRIVSLAAASLQNHAVAYSLLKTGYVSETDFLAGDGNTVRIRVPAVVTSEVFNAAYSSEDHVESTVQLSLSRVNTKKRKFSVEEKRFDLADFTRQVTVPSMISLGDMISEIVYGIGLVGQGNYTGVPGTTPATLQAFLEPKVVMMRNRSPNTGRVGLLAAAPGLSLASNTSLISVNLAGTDQLLRQGEGDRGSVGPVGGVNWWTDQTVDSNSHTPGTYGPSTVDGAHLTGVATLNLTGGTAVGTVKTGDLLAITGVAQTFVVTADAVAVAGDVAVAISPSLTQDLVGGEAVAIAGTPGVAYQKNLIADRGYMAAIVIPTEQVPDQYSSTFFDPSQGYGVTLKRFPPSSVNGESEYVFEAFVGAVVVRPELGCLLLS